jgi:hypothetical protein
MSFHNLSDSLHNERRVVIGRLDGSDALGRGGGLFRGRPTRGLAAGHPDANE